MELKVAKFLPFLEQPVDVVNVFVSSLRQVFDQNLIRRDVLNKKNNFGLEYLFLPDFRFLIAIFDMIDFCSAKINDWLEKNTRLKLNGAYFIHANIS